MGGDTGWILLAVLYLCHPVTTKAQTFRNKTNASWSGNSYPSTQSTVRWLPDSFNACSAACGGGEQQRLIRCVRDDVWAPVGFTDVPPSMCPPPMPPVSQSCNTHACLGRWNVKSWSKCSVTCGQGVQKREVICESYLWKGRTFQVSGLECGGKSPDKYRKCFERDCPFRDTLSQESSILSENYTLVQIRRAGKLKLNIGGKVKLLAGQTLVVKCPVRRLSRRLIYWSKGYKLIPHSGRVKVTTVGLKIQKADPKLDGGIYTCIAGDRKAKISVQFISKKDPLSKSYRQWAKKSRRRYRRMFPNSKFRSWQEGKKRRKDVLVVSPYIRDGRQRDQSTNTSEPLSFVSGDWSECSVTCGSPGQRRRKVFCSHVTRKYVKMVPDEKCFRQGLRKPADVDTCQQASDCPVWRAGPWSECDPWCGTIGYKSRILVCEWESSSKPAWNSCDISQQPSSRKPCKPTPCPTICQDSSPKCHRIHQLHMCRFRHFREKCCVSCGDFHHPNSVFSGMKRLGSNTNLVR